MDKLTPIKGTADQRFRISSELLIGRLTHIYRTNPEQAARLIERMLYVLDLIQGDTHMRKTYQIDLKIDFDDPARHAMVLKLVRKKARELLTLAHMLADNRPPQIGVSTDDFFEGGTKEALQELGEGADGEVGDGIVDETDDAETP